MVDWKYARNEKKHNYTNQKGNIKERPQLYYKMTNHRLIM